MTGTAKVKFRCGAKLTEKEHFGSFGLFEATCSNRIKVDLVNDGQSPTLISEAMSLRFCNITNSANVGSSSGTA